MQEILNKIQDELPKDDKEKADYLIELIIRLFNLHPTIDNKDAFGEDWKNKIKDLLRAIEFFVKPISNQSHLEKELEELKSNLGSTEREKTEKESQIQKLQEELKINNNDLKHLEEYKKKLEAIKVLEVVLTKEKIESYRLRIEDDSALSKFLQEKSDEIKIFEREISKNLNRLEELLKEYIETKEKDMKEIQDKQEARGHV